MSLELIIAFSIGMFVLSASPGPGVFSTIADALANGFKSSMYFLTGLVFGDIFFLLIAVFGLSYISILLGEFFVFVKIIGGIYLLFLGIKMWRNKDWSIRIEKKNSDESYIKKMLAGLLVTLGNPKAIIFYASLLPTIVDLININPIETITIVLIVAIISYLVIGSYCYMAIKAKMLIKNEKSMEKINKSAGAVMAGAGVYILAK